MNQKQITAIALDILAGICAVLCLILLYRYLDSGTPRRIGAGAVALAAVSLGIYEAVCWGRPTKMKKKRIPSLSALVLLGEDDRPIHIWDLTGKVGLLIGKSGEDCQVDIDLAGTDFETYIDPEHALLNYHTSGWWLQDTSSRNGVSIRRRGQELLLGSHAPARLEPGDVICIAKYTRIAVN